MPPALDAPAHAGMPYYHQGRVPSLTGNGFYDQIPEGVPSTPVTLSANVAAAQAVAYQDTFAVGPPLTMGGPGGGPSAVMMAPNSSNGGRNMRPSHSTAVNYPVQHPRAASTAWRPQDDDALVRARARGENWAQIQTQFPGKTPNACRKRHERLMERRNADDFDTRKMEHIAREYMNMRREIWQPLAQRTGEKWTFVEQKVGFPIRHCDSPRSRRSLANCAVHGQRPQEPAGRIPRGCPPRASRIWLRGGARL